MNTLFDTTEYQPANTTGTQSNDWPLRFFHSAIDNQCLAHGYILKGQNLAKLYQVVLEVAKRLNCQTQNACASLGSGQCPDCRWIDNNAHPAVMTISRLTYLVGDKSEDLNEEQLSKLSKKSEQTQIKVSQINRLLEQVSRSAEHYRVIIFTDAEVLPADTPGGVKPPSEWANVSGNQKKSFHIRPLTRDIFNAASANRFLKTLEEPPAKTMFFFLTNQSENILDTIVSRCQIIPDWEVAPAETQSPELASALNDLIDKTHRFKDYTQVTEVFKNSIIEAFHLTPYQALGELQKAIHQRFQTGVDYQAYAKWQRLIEQARVYLDNKVHPDQTLAHLFEQLHREQLQ